MYRVLVFLAILSYCSSFSFIDSSISKTLINPQNDDGEIVSSPGAGYSYFKKQQVDARPLAQPSLNIPHEDLAVYLQSSAFSQQPSPNKIFNSANQILNQAGKSQIFNTANQVLNQANQNQIFNTANQVLGNAFGQQQLIPRSNIQVQNFLPKTIQTQQPQFIQKDFPQVPSGYTGQQTNLPIQSKVLSSNTFNSQPQVFPTQNNLNFQQKTFGGYNTQQQDRPFIPQPQQTWNTQQSTVSFSSSQNGQGQQPVSSGFIIQSNQQNNQNPVTNGVVFSSPLPVQRFIPQTQPKQYGR